MACKVDLRSMQQTSWSLQKVSAVIWRLQEQYRLLLKEEDGREMNLSLCQIHGRNSAFSTELSWRHLLPSYTSSLYTERGLMWSVQWLTVYRILIRWAWCRMYCSAMFILIGTPKYFSRTRIQYVARERRKPEESYEVYPLTINNLISAPLLVAPNLNSYAWNSLALGPSSYQEATRPSCDHLSQVGSRASFHPVLPPLHSHAGQHHYQQAASRLGSVYCSWK